MDHLNNDPVSTSCPSSAASDHQEHNLLDNNDASIVVKGLQGMGNGSGLQMPIKKVGRRGRPPKKDAKSRNRQGKRRGESLASGYTRLSVDMCIYRCIFVHR